MSLWHSVLRTKIQILGYKNRPLIAEKGMPPYCGVCMPPLTGIKNKQHKKRRCSTGTSRKVIKKFWSGKVIWSFSWIILNPIFCITGCLFWGWSEKQPSNPPWNPFTGPTHPSWAQGTMCRQNSPQWRHFFQGNSPPKKMDQKIVVTIGNHAKWPTFCWIQPELLFRLVFFVGCASSSAWKHWTSRSCATYGGCLDVTKGKQENFKVHAPPSFFHEKKTDFFEGYCKTLLPFPESSFSKGKTDSFRDRNMGGLVVLTTLDSWGSIVLVGAWQDR